MTAKTEMARPRFILFWAFGIGPALYVKRHGGTYKYAGYVTASRPDFCALEPGGCSMKPHHFDAFETLTYVVTGLIILGLIITAILGAGAFQ